MTHKYRAIPIEQLMPLPSRLVAGRNTEIADAMTNALNGMAESGWILVTTCKTASGTIFIFEKSVDPQA